MHVSSARSTVTLVCTLAACLLAAASAPRAGAQTAYDFEIDTTRSTVTLSVALNPPIGNSDEDADSSRVGGSISALLTPAPASFSEIHIDSMQLILRDSIDLDFNFGIFVGSLEIFAPPDELILELTESGPPAAVIDTSFIQPENTFMLTGTLLLDASGPISTIGIGDSLDLDTELIFDVGGSIAEPGDSVELRIPLAIADTTEISGVPLTLALTGTIYAVSGGTSTDVEDEEVPAQIALLQNYPNPFNPRTTIAFTLDQSAEATLQVYDAIGRLVATLVDGPLSAGRHEVAFDASGQPSGVYHYRLSAGGRELHRTMVLLR